MATSLAQLLGLAGPRLLPLIGAAGPAVKQPANGELAQARAAAQAPSVLPRVGTATAEPEYLPPDAAMGGAPALLPAVGGAPPRVTNPLNDQIERQQELVNKDLTPQTPFHDLSGWGKVGRVLGTIGGATRFAPYIPGTQENRLMRTSADMGALNQLTGLEDKAQTQARGEEEVGLRRQQLEDAENKQPANPWAEMKDYFGPNGEPVERHTMTGEIRMVPLPAGVTRAQATPKLAPESVHPVLNDALQPTEATFDNGKWFDPAGKQIMNPRPIPPRAEGRAGGGEEKNLWSVPQPDGSHKVVALRAGDTIPNGAVSLAGYSTQSSKEGTADAPTTSALKFANDYLASGKYTGPSDEALQDQFFQMAKPSTGFRMNQAQISQLHNMASWMNSAEGMAYHASTGTWFAPEQRKEIVQTMNDLAKSKGINTASGAAPKEGDMKTNGAGDKVKFTGGKWVVQ